MKTCLGLALSAAVSVGAALAQDPQGNPTGAAPFGDPVQDNHIYTHALFDQLEGRLGARNGFRWEGEGWTGTDMNRLWLKTEGFVNGSGDVEDGQHELLYDRPITSFFDAQTGLRLDADSRKGRTWAALGVEGLAPLFFHVSGTLYFSGTGHYGARLEGDYDLLLTQRLILQPQIEMNLYTKDDPGRGTGSGLSDLDAGLRLRYEISRKFAPYIAVTFDQKCGKAANFARSQGEGSSELRFTVGVRTWL